jgi:hypothetical protein
MDYQVLFNGAVALAAFFGGYVLNTILRSIERLDSDVRSMPLHYVTKDDYKTDIKELKEMIGKIFDRLENKADR